MLSVLDLPPCLLSVAADWVQRQFRMNGTGSLVICKRIDQGLSRSGIDHLYTENIYTHFRKITDGVIILQFLIEKSIIRGDG